MARKRKIDERIKPYTTKDGKTLYMFKLYIGIDPLTGKRKQTTRRGFEDERSADLALSRLEWAIEDGEFEPQQKSAKYQELYDMWLPTYQRTVRESTYAVTVQIFDKFILPQMSGMYVDKLKVIDCQKLVNHWSEVSPKRFKRLKNYASNVIDYACAIEVVQNNPFDKVMIPKIENKNENNFDNFYNKEELKRFLDEAKRDSLKVYSLFRLLAYTGMRKGECLALTWSDIDEVNQSININKTVARGLKGKLLINSTKTTSGNRTIGVDAETLTILKRWRKEQAELLLIMGFNSNHKDQLIFSNNKNSIMQPSTPIEWLQMLLKRYESKTITVHGLRHTHCSLLFEAGASIQEVKERLGHADITTTMNIYTHVTQEKKSQIATTFADYLEHS